MLQEVHAIVTRPEGTPAGDWTDESHKPALQSLLFRLPSRMMSTYEYTELEHKTTHNLWFTAVQWYLPPTELRFHGCYAYDQTALKGGYRFVKTDRG